MEAPGVDGGRPYGACLQSGAGLHGKGDLSPPKSLSLQACAGTWFILVMGSSLEKLGPLRGHFISEES